MSPPPGHTLTLTRTIQAPVGQVYRSFVNRDDLCDWFCHNVDLLAKVGGYAFFMWKDAYFPRKHQNHAYGVFTELEDDTKIVLSWQDGGAIGVTQVRITFAQQGKSTVLTLTHDDFADEAAVTKYRELWEKRLDNLKSILETGENLDIADHVHFGLLAASPNNAQTAAELGVPVTTGILVGEVVPSFMAEAAGLQPGDVLIEINGESLTDKFTPRVAMRRQLPGDVAAVGYYRGGKKYTGNVELTPFPVPPIPANFLELADRLEETFARLDNRLLAVFDGVPETVADTPIPFANRTIRKTLAYLVLSTPGVLGWLGSYTQPQGTRREYASATREKIAAIVRTYPTVAELLAQFRRNWNEQVALIRAFPPELAERKNYLWWITLEIDYLRRVYNKIIDQIEEVIAKTITPRMSRR